jgi:predicted anti-sigma-YlaC factor YlaD
MLRRYTCRNVRNLLPLHVGGDLPARQAAPVDEHLGTCLACFREFRDLTAMRERIGVLTEQPLPEGVLDGFAEEIMARIAVGEPGPRAELPVAMERARLWPRYAAAAALLVAGGLGLHVAGVLDGAPAARSVPGLADSQLAEAGGPSAEAADDAGTSVAPAAAGDEALAAADDLGIFAPPVDVEAGQPLARPPVYDGDRSGTAVVSESTGGPQRHSHAGSVPSFSEGARVLVDAAGSRVILVLPHGGGLEEESGREKRLREP